ncbi:MAG TPA: FAD-dependent oxidoreductase [Kofleriaceae bacterium]|nr:FAD-dependent oxidoreductase [Kofleriaceae bacterium]
MARVVVLGAGISGHTAAMILRRKLGRDHEVVVVTPNRQWNWIPSNIWVGVGRMTAAQVTFPLAPIYKRLGITLHQARAVALHPEGDAEEANPYVAIESTAEGHVGEATKITYDYLINATGPKLNFAATPGLGPDGNSLSVCTYSHAEHAAKALAASIALMKTGVKQTFVVGTGHGTCTCEGAAFEYIFNLEFEIRRAGVRDQARIIMLTNEAELGDFGVDGLQLKRGGYVISGQTFAESLFVERGVEWVTGAHVQKVEPNLVSYETLDGESHTLPFDFAMLLPPFTGVGLKAYNRAGDDISTTLFAPNQFMKVDADYTAKPYEQWRAEDWPSTYQSPSYSNVFAVGIAFAPPHQISRPRKTKNGTVIAPAPPRTGMPSGIMGRVVALSIIDRIKKGADAPLHRASMAKMGAACVASAGAGVLRGSAASMTMFPVVPDYQKYPGVGRDLGLTFGEIGSAGHWVKRILHTMFIYKAKARLGWWMIPE